MTGTGASIAWTLFGSGYAELRDLSGIVHSAQLFHPHAFLDQNGVDSPSPSGISNKLERAIGDPHPIDQPSADLLSCSHGVGFDEQALGPLYGHRLTRLLSVPATLYPTGYLLP